jgi:hypothetical protein
MSLAGWVRAALRLLEDRSPVAKYPPDERARAIEFHASLPMALHILCKMYACLGISGQAALMEEFDRGIACASPSSMARKAARGERFQRSAANAGR